MQYIQTLSWCRASLLLFWTIIPLLTCSPTPRLNSRPRSREVVRAPSPSPKSWDSTMTPQHTPTVHIQIPFRRCKLISPQQQLTIHITRTTEVSARNLVGAPPGLQVVRIYIFFWAGMHYLMLLLTFSPKRPRLIITKRRTIQYRRALEWMNLAHTLVLLSLL